MSGVSGKDISFTMHVSNHNSADIKIDVALVASVSASSVNEYNDMLLLNQLVYARDTRIFKGLVLPPDMSLAVRSTYGGYTVLTFGFEDDQ